MTIDQLNELLLICIEKGASDVHLSVGAHPAVRIKGEIAFLIKVPKLTQENIFQLISSIVRKEYSSELEEKKNCSFSYAIPGKGRFRVCVYKQRGTYFITFRVNNFLTPTKEKLRLPDETDTVFGIDSGLILVTGPKSSGRTSTCSYIINALRQKNKKYIVTVEDPIEYLYSHDASIISQMEVGIDINDMYSGIGVAMRNSADVIYLSSMMDTQTIRAALEAARSGKIVVTTMDVLGVVDVIRNIVDSFPPDNANYIRTLLAQSLKCVISQQLIPDVNNDLIPLCEVLYGVKSVANLIRENKIVQIEKVIATGSKVDMLSKDNHLKTLYKNNLISIEILKDFCDDWKTLSMSLAKN